MSSKVHRKAPCMMYEYFHRTELDEAFYAEHLLPRLPRVMIDAHAHFNLPEHVSRITKETIAGDWALECGLLMSYEDACAYDRTLFPDTVVHHVALPWPLRTSYWAISLSEYSRTFSLRIKPLCWNSGCQ